MTIITRIKKIVLVAGLFCLAASAGFAAPNRAEFISGNVRVQFLSSSLLRVEEKGAKGFEERPTFVVVGRDWPGASFGISEQADRLLLTNATFIVALPRTANSISQVSVRGASGELLFDGKKGLPALQFLPAPAVRNPVWLMADSPRIIPPAWGAAPPPPEFAHDPNSGWELGNDAKDVYVFAPGAGGYAQLRRDFLKLTGPVPLPPLFTFGFWHSRYFKYTDKAALELIDTYRQKKIPMDLFALDTDWRVGGSDGYQIETNFFPDLRRFIAYAHAREVRVMLNDHPSPVDTNGVSAKELNYRRDGLASLMDIGADVWWYDRNWRYSLYRPHYGISRDAWGMRLYHDIVAAIRPEQRPLVMSEVEGLDHGYLLKPATPSTHRYPIWWTGDTTAEWQYLRHGVWNAVDLGVESLLPYVNEDLTGHHGMPSPELYVRFMEYGALAPVMRMHSDGVMREPWAFGTNAEAIVSDYIRLRYRLLPYFYSAAQRNSEDGTPLLRRCDLAWPEFPEAADHSQFLLGDDLLVAPVMSGADDFEIVPAEYLRKENGTPGVAGEYFTNSVWAGEPALRQESANINFRWGWGIDDVPKSLDRKNFSARFRGVLSDVPETGIYRLGMYGGTVRLNIGGQTLSFSATNGQSIRWLEVPLEKGGRYPFLIESARTNKNGSSAFCRFLWRTPAMHANEGHRSLWIPPGDWEDVWSGETITGPAQKSVAPDLRQTPMYARRGGIVFSIPQVQSTRQADDATVIVDAFVPAKDQTVTRSLYVDDGVSTNYLRGESSQTAVTLTTKDQQVGLTIQPASRLLADRPAKRTWVIRLHLPPSTTLAGYTINNQEKSELKPQVIQPASEKISMPFLGAGTPPAPAAGAVWELTVPDWPLEQPVAINLRLR